MPAIRARPPLRERCNIQLNVKTSIPNNIYDDYLLSPESPPPPPTRRDRGRTTTCKSLAHTTSNTYRSKRAASKAPSKEAGVPRLLPLHTPTAEYDLPALHRLVPYIYVGFHRGVYLPRSLVFTDGAVFTHVVKITYAFGDFKPGEVDLQVDLARGMILFALMVPKPGDKGSREAKAKREDSGEGEGKTLLTETQLLLARDFLALALPYYAEAHPNPNVRASPDSVRVLITAPERQGAEADIMAVVACYLAWASEEEVRTVVEYIRTEDDVPGVWKGAVRGEDALKLVGRAAMSG
ncbi:hypothetical protein DXG01_016727 [Tephrocybe rancida]|nr:hypothetical protein DXG01_016727 [Tephrocybe rancida]